MRIGIDIVNIEKIKKLVNQKGDKFLNRVYSDKEITLGKRNKKGYFYQYLAGRFAAKEALIKTLDTPIAFKDICILNEKTGKPYVLSPSGNFILSISHTESFATAVCIRMEE